MSSGDPTVSVLIVVRNGANLLPETLESVRDQTLTDWECVVVDDASDDGTPAVIERYVQDDGRFRQLRMEVPGGPYVAANAGLAVTRGRYIARLDGDDIAAPRRLEAQVALLEQRPDLRASGCSWRRLEADGRLDDRVRRFPLDSPGAIKWGVCVAAGLVHSTLCVRRDAIESLGGYAELPAAADYGLWCALARHHWVGMVSESLVTWRQHDSQMSASRLDLQRSLATQQLNEHLRAMGGDGWDLRSVEALWDVGRWQPVDLHLGFDVLARWEDMWRADRSLTTAERRMLFVLTNRIRARHVKWNNQRKFVALAREVGKWIGRLRWR